MVNINPNGAAAAEEDIWGFIQGNRVRTLTFTSTDQWGNKIPMPVGTFYEGDLVEPPSRRQETDPETRELKTFPDGNPKWSIILTLQTQYREDDEDDGKRQVYLNRYGQQALQQEMQAKGLKKFGVGTHVKWTLVGFKPNGGNYQPSKLQSIELSNVQEALTPAQQGAQQMIGGGPQVGGQPVPQQQWATQAQHDQAVYGTTQQQLAGQPPRVDAAMIPAPQPQAPVQQPQQPQFQQPQAPAPAPVQQPVAVPVQQAAPAPAQPAPAVDAAFEARVAEQAAKLAAVGFTREQVVQALGAMPENAGHSATEIDDAIPV